MKRRVGLKNQRAARSKYGAERVRFDGYLFGSRGEASCYQMLKAMEQAGELEVKQVQPLVRLTEAKIVYKPDFLIMDLTLNELVWIEFKGVEVATWRLKRRLWKNYGPGRLRIYKMIRGTVTLTEELVPETAAQI